MSWSLSLGRVAGIRIFIHWTFLILLLWIVISGLTRGYTAIEILISLAFIATLFVCITLHELGHAITAKHYKIKTTDITLLPIGGLARMEGLPDKPMQELMVAIMGPAVNVVISLLLFIVLKATGSFPEEVTPAMLSEGSFLFQLYAVNILLAAFNLIPAFPMDGGRVLRALLSFRLPRHRATRIAASIGQFIAILFVLAGFFYNPFLVFIGLFVYLGAQAEASMEETRAALGNVKVKDVLMHHFSVLQPEEPLSKAVGLLLDSQERSFIVRSNGHVEGVLSKTDIISGLTKFGKDEPIRSVMKKEVVSLHQDDMISDVMKRFPDKRYDLLPVTDGSEVVGVINLENIDEYVQIQSALKERNDKSH